MPANFDLKKHTDLRIKLNTKTQIDGGNGTAAISGTNPDTSDVATVGTQVDFSVNFIDVESITVTFKGTDPVFTAYNFTDEPFPPSFYVMLFDINGDRMAGDFSWKAKGVVAPG